MVRSHCKVKWTLSPTSQGYSEFRRPPYTTWCLLKSLDKKNIFFPQSEKPRVFWSPKILNQGIVGLGARLPLVQHFCAGAGLRLVGLLGFWGSIYRFERLFIQLALHEGKKTLRSCSLRLLQHYSTTWGSVLGPRVIVWVRNTALPCTWECLKLTCIPHNGGWVAPVL